MQLRRRSSHVNYSEGGSSPPPRSRRSNSAVSDDVGDSEVDGASDDNDEDMAELEESDLEGLINFDRKRLSSRKRKRSASREPDREKSDTNTLLVYTKRNASSTGDCSSKPQSSYDENGNGDDDGDDFAPVKPSRSKRKMLSEPRTRMMRARRSDTVNYKDASSSDEEVDAVSEGGSVDRMKRSARRKIPGDGLGSPDLDPSDDLPDFAKFSFEKKVHNDESMECTTPLSVHSGDSPVAGTGEDAFKCYSRRSKNKFIVASDDEDDQRAWVDPSKDNLGERTEGDTYDSKDGEFRNKDTGDILGTSEVDETAARSNLNCKKSLSKHPFYEVDSFGLRIDDEYGTIAKRIDKLDRVEKVLSVRNRSGVEPIFCVKLHGKSYRKVLNVLQGQLLIHSPAQYRTFLKKMDLLKRVEGHAGEHENSPAFNPHYLKIDRIVAVEKTNRYKRYLVKWRALPYSEATWEREDELLPDDVAAVKRYYFVNSKAWRKCSPSSKLVFKDGRCLRDYQEEGVAWLDNKYVNGVNCILADEMGLGKTIQSVAMLETLRIKHNISGPFLVIAPVSTLGHWQREVETLTDMNCVVYTGNQEDRIIIREYEFKFSGDSRSSEMKFNVLLTSFEMLMKDQTKLAKIKWRFIVVDEAHRLKSRESKTTLSLKQMNVTQGGLLLLTGTPVQNNTKEIFSLLNVLDSERFASEEEFLIKYGDLRKAEQVKELQENVLRPRLLRRMKENVEKSIPQKEETIVWVELTRDQRIYYRYIYENNVGVLLKGSQGSNVPSLRNVAMELRKVCNHPFLCDGLEEDYVSKHRTIGETSLRDGKDPHLVLKRLQEASGKMVLVDKLLPMLKDAGRRVLIFSQFTMMLDLLEDYLVFKGYTYERIDGTIRGSDRQAAIDRYSANGSDRFIFLLSTRAGGLGITLTAADTCIIYDSDWNPQNDLQAMARCHRIGQTKDVKIYRLITRNTYEQQLFECSSRKYGLDEAILGNRVGADDDVEQSMDIENLLKNGAYDLLKDDGEEAAAEFSAQNISQILEHRTQKRLIGGRGVNTFSVATFVSNTEVESEPTEGTQRVLEKGSKEFWQELLPEACKACETPVEKVQLTPVGSRRKRARTRVDYREDHKSASDDETHDSGTTGGESPSDESSVSVDSEEEDGIKSWSERELKRLEDRLMVLGRDRTTQTRHEAQLEHRNHSHVEQVSETIIQLCFYFENNKSSTMSSSPPQKGSDRETKYQKPEEAEKSANSEDNTRTKESEADAVLEMLPPNCILANDLESGVNYRKEGYILVGDKRRPIPPVFARKAMKSRSFTERLAKNASRYIQVLHEREILANAIRKNDPAYLPPKVPIRSKKIPSWWGPQEDLDLLIGVHRHGHREFKKVRMDPTLCFAKRKVASSPSGEQTPGTKDGILETGTALLIPPCENNSEDGGQVDDWPPDIVLAARLKKLIQLLPNGISSRDNKPRCPKSDKKRMPETSGNAEKSECVAAGVHVEKVLPAMIQKFELDADNTPTNNKTTVCGKENEIPLKRPSPTVSSSKKHKEVGVDNTRQQSIIGYLSSKVTVAS